MTNKQLRVRGYLTRNPITVTADSEIMRAVHLLLKHDISGMPVVDDSGKLVGVLTERDCIRVAINARYFDEPGGRVFEYMSTEVKTVSPEDSLMDIGELFVRSSYRRFPVVEDGRLLGIIGRRDFLRAMKEGARFGKQ